MKFLALFLVAGILFLSFNGTIRETIELAGKNTCCSRMSDKSACSQSKGQNQNKDCGKQGCPMMFSCSICGFLKVEPLQLQTNFPHFISKPVPPYKPGDLSAYHPSPWKPPKNC
jgi:hypothetical protein